MQCLSSCSVCDMGQIILMYNLESDKGRRIKFICLKHKIRIKVVMPEQYLEPIGYLAGLPDLQPCKEVYKDQGFEDEMLVFKGFDSNTLNLFLREFSKNKIERVALKAVLTPDNIKWNSLQLYEEIKKEHEALH